MLEINKNVIWKIFIMFPRILRKLKAFNLYYFVILLIFLFLILDSHENYPINHIEKVNIILLRLTPIHKKKFQKENNNLMTCLIKEK